MRFFIDSANVDEVREAASWGILSGATTNPTLVAKEGKDFRSVVQEIAGIVQGPVSAEVVSQEAEGMIREAEKIATWSPHVVIKVPLTAEGLKATHQLSQKGIKTNVTLVFTAAQGLLAARAGATYVSPFIGRLDDISEDGMQVVRDLADIFEIHDLPTQIIAASIRHPRHVVEAALAGAHIATVPFKVLEQLLHHPLTDSGLERFLSDWKKLRPEGGI
ncbi:MAG: fructose-6-phosphate aldolase [Limnochordaceae bacterium]|nr:fructose-6-phosphate aldolase [Limnochordaceae bacterium]